MRIAVVQAITSLRVIAALVFAAVVLTPAAHAVALGAYLTGLVSDVLDGVLARRLHVESEVGGAFDGFADKALTVVSVLFLVATSAPLIPCSLILLRDVFVLSLRALHFVGDVRLLPPSRLTGALSGLSVRLATLYVLVWHGRPHPSLLATCIWIGAVLSLLLLIRDLWDNRVGITQLIASFRRSEKDAIDRRGPV